MPELAKQDQAATKDKPRFKKRLWRWARSLLLIYLFVVLAMSMLQEWLIFPGHMSQGRPESVVLPSDDRELVKLKTSTGDEIAVLFFKATSQTTGKSTPTLIFFYGNAMNLADTTDLMRDWRKLGANVLGVEFPGYGMSSGKPGEEPFYAAANAAWDYLVQRPDVDKTRIIPIGISIGTGVAVDLAHTHPAAGLVLLAPFTSLGEVAKSHYPFLPVDLILRHKFLSEQKIAELQIPILIIHGNHDSIIPSSMSQRLAKAATKADVTTLFLDTDHNDLLLLGETQINQALKQFIDRIAQKP